MEKFLLLALLLTGCSLVGYNGMDAEEWANKYEEVRRENEQMKSQISNLEYERDEFQYALEDLESTHQAMIQCITGGEDIYFQPVYTNADWQRNFNLALSVMRENIDCTKQ